MKKIIPWFGKQETVICDGVCSKAWGINNRPKTEDEKFWRADGDLGEAPADPGTYEGGEGKPCSTMNNDPELMNKWCVRECERCYFESENSVRDFSAVVAL